MKLEKVLKGIYVLDKRNYTSFDIKGISINSKNINGANLFVCLKGNKFDSHNEMEILQKYIDVFIVEEFNDNILKTQIKVSKTSKILTILYFNFNNINKTKIKFIGITGTNGKTTTSYYIKHILENLGKKVALLGTNGCFINGKKYQTKLTTPTPEDFVELLKIMIKEKIEYLVMEVSAHAILQNRLYGLNFTIAGFTNLTQDHLDDFSSIYEYAYYKFSFIKNAKKGIVNVDDKFGAEFARYNSIITYGCGKGADIQFSILSDHKLKLRIKKKQYVLETSILPKYNFVNLVLAISICLQLGFQIESIGDYLTNLPEVDGRYNLFEIGNRLICIDYAHTPDAIEKILCNLKDARKDLIVIFGASGFRDSVKREQMGKIASKYAKFIVLTADNPRYENVSQINEQISELINVPYVNIPNREDAIKYAIEISTNESIVAILGKGNEDNQDICAKLIPYSDYDTCLKFLGKENNNGDENE